MSNKNTWTSEQLIRAAKLYYEQGWSAEKIAKRFETSRATVQRRLTEARSSGEFYVRVTTDNDQSESSRLATKLKKKYPCLIDAGVVSGSERCFDVDPETAKFACEVVLDRVARRGASALRRYLKPSTVVAVGSGVLVKMCISEMRVYSRLDDVDIVPLTGFLSPDPKMMETSSNFLGDLLQKRVGGRFHSLPVIGFVSETDRTTLENLPIVRDTLPILRKTTNVIVSVRPVDANYVLGLRHTRAYLGKIALQRYMRNIMGNRARRPVGVIGSQGFYADGKIVQPILSTLGMGLQNLRDLVNSKSGHVILVAGASTAKRVKAIDGALNGHFCNILITDSLTAKELLSLPDELGALTNI